MHRSSAFRLAPGVTLFETLLALAMLVLVAAVALPPLVATLEQAEGEESAEQLTAAVALASIDASRSGSIVRLRLRTERSRTVLVAETVPLSAPGSDERARSGDAEPASAFDVLSASAAPDEPTAQDAQVPPERARVLLVFPRALSWSADVDASPLEPEDSADGPQGLGLEFAFNNTEPEPGGDFSEARPPGAGLLFGTLLPDGRAIPGSPLRVTARNGRTGTVTLAAYPPRVTWIWEDPAQASGTPDTPALGSDPLGGGL